MPGQEGNPELRRLGRSEVGQFPVGRTGAGQTDAQLRHAQHPAEQRAHDVDRLDAGERQAL